ncbi:intercellular adhesion molecule 1 isoform X1 [Equus caballus]|uniref:intercellular adhesion molecule 1 isoform X1 n=1 Tax=Equus caballus TaxID=9796 RepID=UPI0038B3861D
MVGSVGKPESGRWTPRSPAPQTPLIRPPIWVPRLSSGVTSPLHASSSPSVKWDRSQDQPWRIPGAATFTRSHPRENRPSAQGGEFPLVRGWDPSTQQSILDPGFAGAQISVTPPEAIIPRGGSVTVNCSASCAELGLEIELSKKEVAQGVNWKTFELSDVREDISPICYANCPNQTESSVSITVYGFPDLVELEPLPSWQPVGQNLTLRCQVAGGAPRDNLTVVLLRGEEELSRQPAVGEPALVNHTVEARREDHGANFSCRAELDLRSRGLGLFQNSSAPRQLRTYVLPDTNLSLSAPRVVEAGTQVLVECVLGGLFPASEAQVHLALEDHRLNATITYNGDSLVARAPMQGLAGEEGTQQLVCVVALGGRDLRTREKVTIYSFPAPNLTLSQPEVSEGTLVSVECEAHSPAVVTLHGASASRPSERDQIHLNASAEDNKRIFSCLATLKVAGQMVHKNQTRELRVLYGPRLDKRDCSGNWTWPEGSKQTANCQAWGNPTPKLTCSRKDGALLPIGTQMLVKREIAGTYLCRAESSHGKVTREVVVNVIYHQNNVVIIILVAAVIILGTVGTAAYIYNRRRKIQIYELQKKAQEAAALKLNALASPP